MKKIGYFLLAVLILSSLWSGSVRAEADEFGASSAYTSEPGAMNPLTQFQAFDATTSKAPEFTEAEQDQIVPGQVLVKYKKGSAARTSGSRTAAFTAKALETDEQLEATKFELLPGATVYQTIKELSADPNISYVQPVYRYKASSTSVSSAVYSNDPWLPQQWGLDVTHISSLWAKVSEAQRKQIKIAIVDTGVDLNHPDLKDSLLANEGANFITPSSSPNDDHGHGTHVAGIAAAITNNSLGIAGAAGSARIIPIKALDNAGDGTTLSISKGIIWAADHGANIINLSLGGTNADPYLQDSILYAQQKGAVIVAASGNYGSDQVDYPAAYPNVIAVGALAKPSAADMTHPERYSYASFSNKGTALDVVAPGDAIYSTLPNGQYGTKDGTSMATPFVTGLAALLKAADTTLTADQIQSIITATSVDLGTPGRDNSYGYGLIDGVRSFDTPRLSLQSGATVATATYTYLPLVVHALDFSGHVNTAISSTTSGSVLLKVEQWDAAAGQWLPASSLDQEVSLSGGISLKGMELPLNHMYRVNASSKSSDKPYVSSGKVYSSASLPSSNAKLQYIKINNGQYTLTPAFQEDRTYYETQVDYSVASISVSAAAAAPSASLTLKGIAVPSGGSTAVALHTGVNLIPITVTAEDHSTQTYTLSIYRQYSADNNFISDIYINSGALSPDFNKDLMNYTLYLDKAVSKFGIAVLLENKNAKLAFNGQTVPEKTLLTNSNPYPVGASSLTISVTAENGSVRNYVITIKRLEVPLQSTMLKSLTLSGVDTFSPVFSPEVYNYQAAVKSTTSQVTLSAATVDPSTLVTLNGKTITQAGSETVNLDQGTTTLRLAVNGDSKTYSISILRLNVTSGVDGGGGGNGGRSGGGGGGFFIPPATDTGNEPVVVKADNAQLRKSLEDNKTTRVTIDATTGSSASAKTVEFGADILKLATDKNKPILIDTGRQTFELSPGSVPAQDSTAAAKLVVTRSSGEAALSKKPAQANDVSLVYDFNLSVGDDVINRFTKPVTIQWKLGTVQSQLSKLGVYYYYESGQSWVYMGGKASADGMITFTTDHFSPYAVMEYNKTFNDMAQHWAKEEVELLASKYIITGATDTTFVPEQKLTRAEFAALLVRALGVKAIGSTGKFHDVNPSDWFHDVVYQAYGAGLIEGVDTSVFAPSQPITREQMAVMIMRAYSIGTGKQASDIAIAQEVKFTDQALTGSWARDNVRLANGIGLMSGFPDGSFKPSETANRSQAAVVIKRLLDLTQQ
ncbi:S8 family serine peptidase [Paenibacillus radicis (ex Xue et al. 2023)]|uniref:S8 family serine peptidase n=1 Tax=Paenibacillus radicis (ex Xue et al. 2023) TaxID=2972489 RepID=A0ABT1YS67_9BACL|nr:S8 family serine peptidase [Paenibacillus radicis (ex Xue et al. 2023)]MCR8636022.1 S8 family serine peptidase [Paenibacillus radicis (ex Xue et al. 2023)]